MTAGRSQAASPAVQLDAATLDVLVVGGGITGACVALEASRRGLRTALVERGDFAGGATSNCLKIVHGGLRYVQHLDWRRMRDSIAERSMWLRSAPHLVEPLPVVMPTWRGRFPPRVALAGALAVNEIVSVDRNRGLQPDRRIPAPRLLSGRACAELVPAVDTAGLTGGVLFHDAIMYSPERLTLEVVAAARAAGAIVANHVELMAVRSAHGRIRGARLRDVLSGDELAVETRWIINATGSAAPHVAQRLFGADAAPDQEYSVALNFVTRRPAPAVAYTITGGSPDPDRVLRSGGRQLFVVPWRGQMMVGTAHLPFTGDPASYRLSEEHVSTFLAEIATASPPLELTRDEISLVHWGLLPVAGGSGEAIRLLKRHRLLDHAAHGHSGGLSVVSVKFTTARSVAAKVVDRITGPVRDGPTAGLLPLPGGRFVSLDQLRREATSGHGAGLDGETVEHLVRTYGARSAEVLGLRETLPDWDRRVVPGAPVILAQLVHGAAAEQGRTADDLLWRRTEIGPRGLVSSEAQDLAEYALRLAAGLPPAVRALHKDAPGRSG